jgi:hypothetical protein
MQDKPPFTAVGDILSAGAIIGTFVGWLPAAAALAGFVWYLIQIWESKTVQDWLNKRLMLRKARRIAKLRAKEKVIVAQLEALETIRQAKTEAFEKVEVAKAEAAVLKVHEETAHQVNEEKNN